MDRGGVGICRPHWFWGYAGFAEAAANTAGTKNPEKRSNQVYMPRAAGALLVACWPYAAHGVGAIGTP